MAAPIYSRTTVVAFVAAFLCQRPTEGTEAAMQRAADELCIDVQAVREAIDARDAATA
jgi:hypothetical protein